MVTLGTGIIVFGLWSFVRAALTIFFFDSYMEDLFPVAFKLPAYIILFVMTLIVFLLELYIGMCARSEGKGKQRSILYLILAILGIVCYIIVTIGEIASLFTADETRIASTIASIIIEITSCICMTDLVINSINLRRINKDLTSAKEETAG